MVNIKINCGGTIFETTDHTLRKAEYFGAIIDRWNNPDNTNKPIFFDDSAKYFEIILIFLRDDVVEENSLDKNLLMSKFVYYCGDLISDSMIRGVFGIKSFLDEEKKSCVNGIYTIRFTKSMIDTCSKSFRECFRKHDPNNKIMNGFFEEIGKHTSVYSSNKDKSDSLFITVNELIKNPNMMTHATINMTYIIEFSDSIILIHNKYISLLIRSDKFNLSLCHDLYCIVKKDYYYEYSYLAK